MTEQQTNDIILHRDDQKRQHRNALLEDIQKYGWTGAVEQVQRWVNFLTAEEISDAMLEYLKK